MSTLLQELKRRNVLRVAVLYVVLAWITLQVADVLFGFLKVPEWGGKFLLAFLLLCFPIVLVFAWAFEITPEGIKRESEIDREQSISPQTGRKINMLTGILGGVAILLIIAQALVPGLKPAAPKSDTKSATVAKPTVNTASIAVLPFVDMSAGKDQEYFSDGLSEELLNLLAKIPQLTVISRTSSFQFKSKNEDVRTIGKMLGVAHVLEGSVRKSGDSVRITVQLINAADGAHLWSDTYDRNLDDIFAVQDEIAAAVVDALHVALLGPVPQVRAATHNTEAYNLLLQARHVAENRTKESLIKAVEYLERALAIEPDYALAWAELAQVVQVQANMLSDIPVDEGNARARKAAARAAVLDPKLPDAYIALAEVELYYDWNWTAAERHIRQAEALDPANYETLRLKASLARSLGRVPDAIRIYRRITERNPLQAGAFSSLGHALVRAGNLSAADSAYRKAYDLRPDMAALHRSWARVPLLRGDPQAALAVAMREHDEGWRVSILPIVYHALGRRADSDKVLRDLEQRFAMGSAYQIAEVYAYRGEADMAFKWLDRAYAQRDAGVTDIIGDPLMKNIVGDPRYRALLRKLKLPES